MMSKDNALTESHSILDHPKDECGIFAIFQADDACLKTAVSLHMLQHRGQEAVGILTWDGHKFHSKKAEALVGRVFAFAENTSGTILPGYHAIGHVRYSTTGGGGFENIQPFFTSTSIGDMALAHNGNLTNYDELRESLLAKGQIFQSTSDTEMILQLMSFEQSPDILDRIQSALQKVKGAYSLAFLTKDKLIGVRDPHGIRPLVLGKWKDSYILTSETCALEILDAEFIRDVKPGEIIEITKEGYKSHWLKDVKTSKFCVFEYIYMMRPNSQFQDVNVAAVRDAIGQELAKTRKWDADMVVPVPDSGVQAAIGFAEESGIPYKQAILRSHYVGRTFIQPTQESRELALKLKLTINRDYVKDKKVILVDDSIVRGTTMPKIIKMIRDAGAKSVHVVISSPPFQFPCYYGIDTPSRKELAAAKMNQAALREFIGADSLTYLELPQLYKALQNLKQELTADRHCDACFSGKYPVSIEKKWEEAA